MSDERQNKALVRKILKIDATLFTFGGIAFLLKDKFTDWVLIDAQTDIYLGAALMICGISTFIVADKFFGNER